LLLNTDYAHLADINQDACLFALSLAARQSIHLRNRALCTYLTNQAVKIAQKLLPPSHSGAQTATRDMVLRALIEVALNTAVTQDALEDTIATFTATLVRMVELMPELALELGAYAQGMYEE